MSKKYLPSIAAYKKYGVKPSDLSYMLHKIPAISSDYHDCLDTYYLLYWSVAYFSLHCKKGVITRDSVDYRIILRKTDYATITKQVIVHPTKQLMLSFRSPAQEYRESGLPSLVLVSPSLHHTFKEGK